MIEEIISNIRCRLANILPKNHLEVVIQCVSEVVSSNVSRHIVDYDNEISLVDKFISAKKIEGCSEKTIKYYQATISSCISSVNKAVVDMSTDDLRQYLSDYQATHDVSKVTIDNIRRILSSFFSWLEDEDHIVKSPVRRIHKVKSGHMVKNAFNDEELEKLRDSAENIRDETILDILISTGMRVGELVNLDREDVDFNERECIVFGKGSCQRPVYFDAKTKLHLQEYLNERTDINPALFITLRGSKRLSINAVESRLKDIGKKAGVTNVHPHRFRRTMATMAIEKGMPIEQVQKLLGHARIDTTLHYAMVNQNNVKITHRRLIC